MRLRFWVSWLAVAAILLHAATVARHYAVMFEAMPAELASAAGFDPGAICHVDSEADADGTAQALPGNNQNGVTKPCPVCLGLASVYGLPASEALFLLVPQTVVAAGFVPQNSSGVPVARFSLPQTRGPPSLA